MRKRSAIAMVSLAPLYQTERGLSSLFSTFGEISPERAGLGNVLSNPVTICCQTTGAEVQSRKTIQNGGRADYSRPERGLSSVIYNFLKLTGRA